MLKIGVFSKLSRISIRMLRHYDALGLLVPQCTDDFTNYRYYSEEQLPVAGRITALKDMGFSLKAIGEILPDWNDAQALKKCLAVQRAEVQSEVEEASRRLLLLATAMKRLGKDETMMQYDVTRKEMPARYVASVRQVIPAYNQEHILWKILNEETAPQHVQPAEPAYGLAVFHDAEHKESDVDVEVQICVKGAYKDTAHVVFKHLPPVQIASATYKGGYERITEANEAVANWVRDNGYDFDGVSFCIYHVSPGHTQNPEEYVTEVCYPVRKK